MYVVLFGVSMYMIVRSQSKTQGVRSVSPQHAIMMGNVILFLVATTVSCLAVVSVKRILQLGIDDY